MERQKELDVLCVGLSCYDLVLSVDHHPAADEKTVASEFLSCGGGTAANAAITAARLGARTAFCGYLGRDGFGDLHAKEFADAGVDLEYLVRGDLPTSISIVLVKPDGKRALVNYRKGKRPLECGAVDVTGCRPRAVLFDGHEPHVSPAIAAWAKENSIPTLLDAGSLHEGTRLLAPQVDYLLASEKFAGEYSGSRDPRVALKQFAAIAPNVVVTLGDRGLLWTREGKEGALPAFAVDVVDTTGAGDGFHGAFAAGVARGLDWDELLRFASACGALCCAKLGARPSIPSGEDVRRFLESSHFRRER